MKILLLGKSGLLGNALFKVFSKKHEICAPGRDEADLKKPQTLDRIFETAAPELVLNAAGYTAVDRAEDEPEKAFALNAAGAAALAEVAAKYHAALVHISTDYVFDGNNERGYAEDASASPLSVYARSKAEGERAVLEKVEKLYLVRTAWLFGPGGKNFVDTILQKAERGENLRVVADQRGSPTFTLDLAAAILRLIETKPYGMYHLVNSGSASWYELAEAIFEILGVPQKIIPIQTSELLQKAKRPSHSVLLNTKFPPLRPWKEALAAYLQPKTLIL